MTTTKNTLDQMQADLARQQAEVAAAQQQVEQAAAEAQKRREAAYRKFDEQFVAAFDRATLDQAVKDADRSLTEAILSGDWTEIRAAYVAANRTRELRRSATDRTKTAYQALGVELHTVGLNGPTPLGMVDLFDRVEETFKREAANQAADHEDTVAQARVEAGETAAKG